MWRVSIIGVLFLFSLTSLWQGRAILETPSDSWDSEVEPFVPSEIDKDKAPKPAALLEGLYVQDGQMLQVFNSSTLNYTVTLSPGVTNTQIVARVSLGTVHLHHQEVFSLRRSQSFCFMLKHCSYLFD